MTSQRALVAPASIEQRIARLRGQNVMLDADLARLYGVATRILVQAVRRNERRFPNDFMFQVSDEELDMLRSHLVISTAGHGGRRYRPYAFTEHGVAMLSSVLRSKRAIQVSIDIVRTFVRLRHALATHRELARKLGLLERKYDVQFKVVFDAIRDLMRSPERRTRRIGFHS
jgi:hypothetical protein